MSSAVAASRPPSQFPIHVSEFGGQHSDGVTGPIPHGSLGDFYGGTGSRIGVASLDFYEQMQKEHCEFVGCDYEFTSSNYSITTSAAREWRIVTEGHEPNCGVFGNCNSKTARRRTPAHWWDHHKAFVPSEYMFSEVHDAKDRCSKVLSHICEKFGLLRAEGIAIVLFTGPMYTAYNGVLSKFPADIATNFAPINFTTTIHAIISAIQKLSMRTPVQSIVYRGTGGRGFLPDTFWEPQEGLNVYGYTEYGVMSMTSSKEIALEYSGVLIGRPHSAILAFAAGAVDRGANVQDLSQFPLEVEFTFPPLSYIQPEFVNGKHRVEYVEHPEKPGVQVPVIYVRVNANIRSPTLDEMNSARKKSHVALFRSQNRDTVAEIRSLFLQRTDDITRRFGGRRVSFPLLDELKNAQHAASIKDPVKTAFEGFISVICQQCEAVLFVHEQKDESFFLDKFGHSSLLNEMASVRKWALAKVLWYIEDEDLDLQVILNYPLLKCYREYVSFCRRRIHAEELNSAKRRKHAVFLCQLLGLIGSSDSDGVLCQNGDPIVEAVQNGIGAHDVELLLDAGFDVESADSKGSSLLSIAARYGFMQLLELLIKRGADVNSVNAVDGYRTPIMFAAFNNHLNCLKLLLLSGAQPSSAALQVAMDRQNTECFKALFEAGNLIADEGFLNVRGRMYSRNTSSDLFDLEMQMERGNIRMLTRIDLADSSGSASTLPQVLNALQAVSTTAATVKPTPPAVEGMGAKELAEFLAPQVMRFWLVYN